MADSSIGFLFPEGYNPNVDYTEWFVDVYNMMMGQNPSWKPDGDFGAGDAIGRSFRAYVWTGDPRFLDGIANCWVEKRRKSWLGRKLFGETYYQGYRHPRFVEHPEEQGVGLSRDHLSYTLIAFKYAGYSDEFLKEFVKKLRFRISERFLMTINLWLWARVLAGMKGWGILYYPIEWITMQFTSWWNQFIAWYSGFGPEAEQDDFIIIPNSMKPKRMVKIAKKYYPIYALHIQAWQIKLLSNKWWKRALQKPLWKITPEHNSVIKLLLNHPDRPSKEKVDSYKSMTGGRWTGILNPWRNDRDTKIIKDPKRLEYNVQDVEYLRKLYYTISCD